MVSCGTNAIKADQAGPSGKPGKDLQDATVDRECFTEFLDRRGQPEVVTSPWSSRRDHLAVVFP